MARKPLAGTSLDQSSKQVTNKKGGKRIVGKSKGVRKGSIVGVKVKKGSKLDQAIRKRAGQDLLAGMRKPKTKKKSGGGDKSFQARASARAQKAADQKVVKKAAKGTKLSASEQNRLDRVDADAQASRGTQTRSGGGAGAGTSGAQSMQQNPFTRGY